MALHKIVRCYKSSHKEEMQVGPAITDYVRFLADARDAVYLSLIHIYGKARFP